MKMDWHELHDKLSALPALESKMDFLLGQIWEAKSTVDSLLKKYEQERINTQRIQKESLSSALLKLTGRYETRLKKEQNDEINAKLEYDQAINNLSYLRGEQQELSERIAELKKDEEAYNIELESRRKKLMQNLPESAAKEFAEIDKEHDEIITEMTNVKEAIVTVSRIKETARKVSSNTKSVTSWASVDTAFSGGGMISNIGKYDQLDSAEETINTLFSQITELKAELSAISGITAPPFPAPKKNVSSSQISDFMPTEAETNQIVANTEHLQESLELKLLELNKALKKNRKREWKNLF
jgi:hypothetical protein